MQSAHVYAFALAALCVVCGTVLVAMGHPVPDFLQLIGGTAIGGAAGLSLPQAQPQPPPAQPVVITTSGGTP